MTTSAISWKVEGAFNNLDFLPSHLLTFDWNFSLIGGADYKLIYRHYATLYFVFCVDSSESELGILDLIQVFVETLDKCFENVCELDLIFHVDKVGLLSGMNEGSLSSGIHSSTGPLHPQRAGDGRNGFGDQHDGNFYPN